MLGTMPALVSQPVAGRSLAEFKQLSSAEMKLMEACRTGTEALIAEIRPVAKTSVNVVRATFVRFPALGGDATALVHQNGVWLTGAWIDGILDLDFCTLAGPLQLQKCHLVRLDAAQARISRLNLTGSHVETGINADGIKVIGDLFLNDNFTADGDVRLLGATIGGDFDCRGGKFNCKSEEALAFHNSTISGNVYLKDNFTANGSVGLRGTSIRGNLECSGGSFNSTGGDALSCSRATIEGNLFLDVSSWANGTIRLSSAKIGGLIDPEANWPQPGQLLLDGIQIGRFAETAPTSGDARVRWLLRQHREHPNEEFRPQPWEETIRVLREMGHDDDARTVAIAKQDQMRKAGKVTSPFLHAMWGGLAGYGYRPLRLVGFLAATWLFSGAIFWAAEAQGVFAPTSPVLQTDAKASAACRVGPDAGDAAWTRCTTMPDAYTTFQPLLYSLDLILPLVDLQQELDWAPAVTINGEGFGRGIVTRWVMWFEILFGWVASLMLVAILTNLVKKD